jgi:urea carboxylase system permease
MQEPTHSDSHHLAQFGYRQELHRTLGSFSSFAAGYSYISILTGMFQTSYLGFLFAGPAFVWAWIFVMFGQFMVALQFAELSAHYPLAGSVYQWSKQIASKAWSWNTGWMYLCAQVITVPAVALAWQVILPQISTHFQIIGSAANSGNYFSKDFAENAVVLAMVMVVLTTIINMSGVAILARINNIGVIAELVGASGLIILFLIHTTRSPVTVLTTTQGTGAGHAWGWFGALLIGAIMPLYVMYGFDSAGSLAEETDDPRRKAPKAVLQALATAGSMGFLLILFGAMAVSDKGFAGITGLNGLTSITTDVLGSTWGKVFLADVAVAIFVCCLAIHAMSVRIMFAMGRDDNLPGGSRLAHVSGTRRVPVFPAILVGVISILVLAFNIYNQYAFEVIIALGIVFMYLAYLGVTIPLLQKRRQGWPQNLPDANDGLFSLGRYAIVTNVLAIVYGASMAINLAWPREEFYGTKWYQHYGPITGISAVVIVGLVLYYGRQQHHGTVLAEHRADMPGGIAPAPAEGD